MIRNRCVQTALVVTARCADELTIFSPLLQDELTEAGRRVYPTIPEDIFRYYSQARKSWLWWRSFKWARKPVKVYFTNSVSWRPVLSLSTRNLEWNRPDCVIFRYRSNTSFNAMRSNDQSLRNTPDVRMSSPFVDPNSLDFLPFSNQPQSVYPQNSNYNGFHSQHAGDLHTPVGFGITNPFSQQLGNAAPMDTEAANMGLNQFGQQFFSSPFQNPQPFAQQPSFAPSAFQQDPGFDPIDKTIEKSSLNELELQEPSLKMPASDVDMAGQSEHQNPADQK